MPVGRIDTRGSILLGAVLALGVAGLLRVDGTLLVLGGAGGILLVMSWLLGWLNCRGLMVEVEMPEVVQAGYPMRVRVTVRNPRRILDAFGLGMRLRMPGGVEVGCLVPWVPSGSAADTELRETPLARGHGDVVGATVTSSFPLGLFGFSRVYEVPHSLRVLPLSISPNEMAEFGSKLEAEPCQGAMLSEALGEPRGLREYRAGDSAKLIVWPASLRSRARGGGIMVRELDPPGFHPQKAVVLFHSHGSDGALIRPDRFERAISLVWGSLKGFQARGVRVVLVADFEEWVPLQVVTRRQLGEVGTLLVRAKRARGTEEHELANRLSELEGEPAVVVISDMPVDSWRRQLVGRSRVVAVDIAEYEGRRREGRRSA